MRPNFRPDMSSQTSLHRLKQEPRFVSITSSHILRSMRFMVPSRVMPALFTRISIGPYFSRIPATAALHCSKSPTSKRMQGMPVRSVKALAASSLPA
ncbi:hypothetical protein ROTAS13_04807 [Roseomonas sp. TAS13]|nr:hypothetical protein ROTAS13_04807 [Roseomonas sp. TAS13]